jgi:hypothetical protein
MSEAAQVVVAVIPIVGIVVGSVVVFFYLLWLHQRTTLLIKSGQYRKPNFDLLSFSLLTGLLLSIVGICLTVFIALIQGLDYALFGGIIPLAIGISLLAYYAIKRFARG